MNENRIIRLDETGSTNEYALQLLEKETLPAGTVVIAENQTAGRGVDGSLWESQKGRNLTFSMIIYPDYISVDYQFYLNKAISLGVYHLVREKLGDGTSIKWPNDIYFGNGKIAGILIQNGIQGSKFKYCVAGIGLNVNQDTFSGRAENPVSLNMVSGREYDLEALMNELYASLWQYLDLLKNGHIEQIDGEYLSALFRLEEMARYIYKGEKIMARITGVNRYGHLVLEIPSHKIIECDLKEIKFVI